MGTHASLVTGSLRFEYGDWDASWPFPELEQEIHCTTCHDPHSDRNHDPGRVPRFWVKPTVDEVCLACHELR